MLKTLQNKILKCKKCPRLNQNSIFSFPHVYFNDNLNEIEIFIIVQNPGIEHDYTAITNSNEFYEKYKLDWLNCKLGKYLISELGIETIMTKVFFTNLCKCSSPNNSNLNSTEIYNCCNFLYEQIQLVNPKKIFLLGNETTNHILNKNIKFFEKTIKSINNIDYEFYKLYHPSYVKRFNDKDKNITQSIELKKIINS